MPPPNLVNAAIATRLVQARQAADFATLEAAGIRLGLNPRVYATHEQGRSAVKSAELRRYAETFGWRTAG